MDLTESSFLEQESDINYSFHKSRRKPPRLKPEGYCHNCFEDLEDPNALFCNSRCAEQYEYTIKLKTK